MSRVKRIFAGLFGAGSLATWFFRETIKTWFFDHIVHMASPVLGILAEYGPPASFAVICVYLIGGFDRIINFFGETQPNEQNDIMSLRQLFMHIDPRVIMDEKVRDTTGREIADSCASGKLASWGRRIDRSRGRLSLTPIPPEHWQKIKYTYWFLHDEDAQPLDFNSYSGVPGVAPHQYADVRFNREQALKLWSAALQKPYPDTPLASFVTQVLGTAAWLSETPGQADRLLSLLSKIGQEAALSTVTVWGRKSNDLSAIVGLKNNLEPIPASYWTTHVVDEIQFLETKIGRTRHLWYTATNAFEDLHLSSSNIRNVKWS
jgi:hypothetical protein